jgi:paraquat-inducible protein B
MSRRANATAIGAFVVGGVVLIILGIITFGSIRVFRQPLTYVMFFDTSVAGLSVGAPVEFRGVKVGRVTRIEMRWGTSWISVFMDLDPRGIRGMRERSRQEVTEDIERVIQNGGLRAQLRTLSFVTGQLYVALDLFPQAAFKLTGLDLSVPEIPTVPSALETFSDRAEKLMAELEHLQINRLVNSMTETVEGIKTIVQSPEVSRAVQSTADLSAGLETLAQQLNEEVGPLLASIKETSDTTRVAMTEVSQDVRRLLARAEVELGTLHGVLKDSQQLVQKVEGEVGPLASSLRGAFDEARVTLEKARGTLGAIDGTLGGDSSLGYQLTQTLEELTAASRSLRVLSEYLDRHPEALLQGKGRPGGN